MHSSVFFHIFLQTRLKLRKTKPFFHLVIKNEPPGQLNTAFVPSSRIAQKTVQLSCQLHASKMQYNKRNTVVHDRLVHVYQNAGSAKLNNLSHKNLSMSFLPLQRYIRRKE